MGVLAGRASSPEVTSDAAEVMRRQLGDGSARLGLALDARQLDRLLDYLGLLARWNRVYNLTSVREPADMLTVHLLDSLSVVRLVEGTGARTILDVGTGPGLPGIPLAICLPDATIDLVDAVAKKVAFLQQAKGALGLTNIHPRHARVEALTLAQSPDLIISRAYAELKDMLKSVAHLATPSTTVVAMKGAVPHDEVARIPAGWAVVDIVELDVPQLGAQRCAVVLNRIAAAHA